MTLFQQLAGGAQFGHAHARTAMRDDVTGGESDVRVAVLASLRDCEELGHDNLVPLAGRTLAHLLDVRRRRVIDHLERVETIHQDRGVIFDTADPALRVFEFGQLRVRVRHVALDELDGAEEVDDLDLFTAIVADGDIALQQPALLHQRGLYVRRVHLDVMFRHGIGSDCFSHCNPHVSTLCHCLKQGVCASSGPRLKWVAVTATPTITSALGTRQARANNRIIKSTAAEWPGWFLSVYFFWNS